MNKKNVEAIYPLSPAQHGMLFHSLYAPQASLYIEQLTCTLRGPLDSQAFRAAWQRIVERHAILRTLFVWERRDQPLQIVRTQVELPWQEHDWSDRSSAEQAMQLTALLNAERAQGFDLSTAPLLRLHLIRLAPTAYQLVLHYHHLLMDAWSFALLFREVLTAYSAFCDHREPHRPFVRPYRDYIVWLQQQDVAQAEAFWRATLRGFSAPTTIGASRSRRPAANQGHHAEQRVRLSSASTAALQSFARQQRLTLNTLAQGAWALLLSRYSGEQDVLFGNVVAGRPAALAGVETIVGPFINTLAVRVTVDPLARVLGWLHQLQQQQTELHQYEWSPLAQVQSWSELPRGVALFESILAFESQPVASTQEIESANIEIDALRFHETTNYPLTVRVVPGAELLLWIDYDPNRFDAPLIERMLSHFQTILTGLIAQAERRLTDVALLSAAERQQMLGRWPLASYSSDLCLHQLFEAQVARTPDAAALVCGDQRLSYRELNQRANRLAHVLRAQGVGATDSETYVGLYLERSVALVVAILAVLKAGGAYVPIDPAYPQERLHWILSDTQAAVLVTQRHLRAQLDPTVARHSLAWIELDEDDPADLDRRADANLPGTTTAAHAAYVIYTSGSTGQPKGVIVTHSNVVRLFAATSAWFQPGAHDVWTLFHSYAFDFSVWELWGALLYGGRLVVVPYIVSRDPDAFAALLHREQVTVLSQTPSAFRQLMHAALAAPQELCAALRLVIFGGEALKLPELRPWLLRHGDQRPQLVNMYGITETTVHVTYRPIRLADLDQGLESVIGQPIPDLQLYLLDQHSLEPLPPGMIGELYVGGAGLARGYLHRPALTAELFIPDPFGQTGARLYKTGDTARYLNDGELEYVGRTDQQVKLRGFRIELGEIEAALRSQPGVRDALVLLREDHGDQQLVAYVVGEQGAGNAEQGNQEPGIREPGLTLPALSSQSPISSSPLLVPSVLRSALALRLPGYMLPSAFVFLEALPLTANGKLDRHVLTRSTPEPESVRADPEATFVAPQTSTEQALAAIWSEVLGVTRVGVHENFFALGGDSIRSIRVLAYARQQHLPLTLQQLFEHPTIAALAREIDGAAASPDVVTVVAPFSLIAEQDRTQLPADLADAYPLTRLQLGMLFHSEYSADSMLYHNVNTLHLRGRFDLAALREAARQLVALHPILRTSFNLTSFSQPLQLVNQSAELPIQTTDLRLQPPDQQVSALAAWFEDERRQKFDWTQAPLIRFHVHLRSDDTFQFSWSEHHAILDGWSVALLLTELFQRYAYLLGTSITPPTPLPPSSFRDFVALEQAALASQSTMDYWTEKLRDAAMNRLPRWPQTDRATPDQPLNALDVPIPPDLSEALKHLARVAGVPIKSVLLAAHLRVMALLGGSNDVLTGIVSNGRPEMIDSERVLGLFLNTLPLRQQLAGDTWLELIRATFATEQQMLPHRRYPIAEIQRLLGGQGLFETIFNFVHFHLYERLRGASDLEVLDGGSFEQTNFTLTTNFSLDVATTDVRLTLSCDANQISSEQLHAIAAYYANTLAALAYTPESRYEIRSPLTDAERQALLHDWNASAATYPLDKTLHELIEAQVEQTPDAIALVFEDKRLSYADLNHRANQLAHHLHDLGVGAEDLVGVCVERSPEMLIALLGILKVGGAYVPIDPAYPQERIQFMLDDAQMAVLLTQMSLRERLCSTGTSHTATAICLDADWPTISRQSIRNTDSRATDDMIAYVIYTSGSTGRPKGVMVPHRAVVNFLRSMEQQPGLTTQDRLVAVTTLSFDIAGLELFLPLSVGAQVVLARREETVDGAALAALLRDADATVMQATPATWRLLIESGWLPTTGFKTLCGGEALPLHLAQRLSTTGALWNMYGPTETTIWSSVERISAEPTQITIGRPIGNTQMYVLDEHMQPVPVGVAGELYIGGAGVARGYLNRPALTAERFIPDLFSQSPGARLYRSGDRVRWTAAGVLDYLGRLDDQIKLRGYRIEPAEIEMALRQHPAVRDCAVVLRGSGDGRYLAAYVVVEEPRVESREPRTDALWANQEPGPEDEGTKEQTNKEPQIQPSALRQFLKTRLPDYMTPSAFVFLPALPVTANGKLDRRALPDPDEAERTDTTARSATGPRTPVEQVLALIWGEVLSRTEIDVHANFFDLRGHSLLAVQVIGRLKEIFPLDLRLQLIFEAPTIATLSTRIVEIGAAQQLDITRIAQLFIQLDQLSDDEVAQMLAERHDD